MTLGIRDVFMDRSYNLFLQTSALLFLGPVFMLGQALDVHIHDTYYVFQLYIYFGLLHWSFCLPGTERRN